MIKIPKRLLLKLLFFQTKQTTTESEAKKGNAPRPKIRKKKRLQKNTREIWYSRRGLLLKVWPRAGVAETETNLLPKVSSSTDACSADENISMKTGLRSFFFCFSSVPIIAPNIVNRDAQQQQLYLQQFGLVIWSLENSTTTDLLRV